MTDSGVDSEQNSVSTNASTEREAVASASSEAVIERETVSRMRNIFERKISQSRTEAEAVRKPSLSSRYYSYSQPNLLQTRGEFPALISQPGHHSEEEKERSRTSSECSEATVESAVETEQRQPFGGFLPRKQLSETQTSARENDTETSSEISESPAWSRGPVSRRSVPSSEVQEVSVGRLKHNFDGSERTVVTRTEGVKDSEVSQVSVGRLKNSYEEKLVRQRADSEQSFLSWRAANLALKPRHQPQPPVITNTTNTNNNTTNNNNYQDQEPQQDSVSVSSLESLESLEEDNNEGSERTAVAPSGGERMVTSNPATSDIRTGRVSVSQLKHIWAADRVEVNRVRRNKRNKIFFLSAQERKSTEEMSNIPEDLRKFFKTGNPSEGRKEERNFVIME